MLTETAIKHFKSQAAIARALDITPAAVSKWPEIVSFESATALEIVTHGELAVDRSLYPHVARAVKVSQCERRRRAS